MPKQIMKNPAAALQNMVIARDVLAARGVRLSLAFGTLLGALRERNFIAHDDDVDVLVLPGDEAAFLAAFPELEARGLEFLEKLEEPRVYSFARKGEQIDFFVARECRYGLLRRRGWDLDGRESIPYRHLRELDTLEFLGEKFHVPSDPYGVVRNLYGRTWDIPIAGRPARIDNLVRLRKVAAHPQKALFYLLRFTSMRLKWAGFARKARARSRSNGEGGLE